MADTHISNFARTFEGHAETQAAVQAETSHNLLADTFPTTDAKANTSSNSNALHELGTVAEYGVGGALAGAAIGAPVGKVVIGAPLSLMAGTANLFMTGRVGTIMDEALVVGTKAGGKYGLIAGVTAGVAAYGIHKGLDWYYDKH